MSNFQDRWLGASCTTYSFSVPNFACLIKRFGKLLWLRRLAIFQKGVCAMKKNRNCSLSVNVSTLMKTASIAIGFVAFKNGKSLLCFQDIEKKFSLNSTFANTSNTILSIATGYALALSRLPAIWKYFSKSSTNDQKDLVVTESTYEIKPFYEKAFYYLGFVVSIFRAPFNLLNAYIGMYSILALFLNQEQAGTVNYFIGSYAAIAHQTTYVIFTYGKIKENCRLLAIQASRESITIRQQCDMIHFLKFTLMLLLLDSGTLSFSALSYYMGREALLKIPYLKDLDQSWIKILSWCSAISALLSEVLSKNMELHKTFDERFNKFVQSLKQRKLIFLIPHTLLILLFMLSMGLSYFDGTLNLFLDNNLEINTPIQH